MIHSVAKTVCIVVVLMAGAALAKPLKSQQTFTYSSDRFNQGTLKAQRASRRTTIQAESYTPTIWLDPDGCEHWVMDDGFEGFMTPHVTRDGKPVCRRGETCAVMNADQLFAPNKHRISAANKRRLTEFFQNTPAIAFVIEGHTDSIASDSDNIRLSERRARAVAKVARQAGVRVAGTVGYGERIPKASNRTNPGMAINRRVEIQCIR